MSHQRQPNRLFRRGALRRIFFPGSFLFGIRGVGVGGGPAGGRMGTQRRLGFFGFIRQIGVANFLLQGESELVAGAAQLRGRTPGGG